MDNTFLLKFLWYDPKKASFQRRLAARLMDVFNRSNDRFELRFKSQNQLRGDMITLEQVMNIYHLLSQVLVEKIPGDVVELGCYEGVTAIIMQKALDQFNSEKRLHVYDSFQGLPPKTPEDGNNPMFLTGSLKASRGALEKNFKESNTSPPLIHGGWFADTLPAGLPEGVCFAHVDADFYSSTKEALTYLYPRLSKGAVVVIDDYCDPAILDVNNILPGVKKACDEFFAGKKEKMNVLIAGKKAHGYFRKE